MHCLLLSLITIQLHQTLARCTYVTPVIVLSRTHNDDVALLLIDPTLPSSRSLGAVQMIREIHYGTGEGSTQRKNNSLVQDTTTTMSSRREYEDPTALQVAGIAA